MFLRFMFLLLPGFAPQFSGQADARCRLRLKGDQLLGQAAPIGSAAQQAGSTIESVLVFGNSSGNVSGTVLSPDSYGGFMRGNRLVVAAPPAFFAPAAAGSAGLPADHSQGIGR